MIRCLSARLRFLLGCINKEEACVCVVAWIGVLYRTQLSKP